MIRRLFSIWIIIATILMTAIIVSAPACRAQPGDSPTLLFPAPRTFEGLLIVKEADGLFLVRSESGDKKRLRIRPDTVITRNGQLVTYCELRSRDRIWVKYNEDFVALEIRSNGS